MCCGDGSLKLLLLTGHLRHTLLHKRLDALKGGESLLGPMKVLLACEKLSMDMGELRVRLVKLRDEVLLSLFRLGGIVFLGFFAGFSPSFGGGNMNLDLLKLLHDVLRALAFQTQLTFQSKYNLSPFFFERHKH